MRKIIGSTARLIGCVFVMAFVLAGCGKGCGKQGVTSKKALELIPGGFNSLGGINWKKVQDSPLGSKIKEQMEEESNQAFFDAFKNVDHILLGGDFRGPGQSDDAFVAIISGKFDKDAILKLIDDEAKKRGATGATEDYEGIKITSMPKDPKIGLTFIDDYVVVGGKDALKKSIDLSKKKGDSIEKNKELMELAGNIDQSKMFWAVAVVPPGMIPANAADGGPSNPMALLSKLKAIDLAIDYGDSLTVDLGLHVPKESAEQMVTMGNSYKTLFGTSLATKDPALGKLLNGLTIEAKNDRVAVSLKLDKATVEELSNKGKQGAPLLNPGEDDTGDEGEVIPPTP